MIICPLCQNKHHTLFHTSENREYHHCDQCDLVYVPKHYFINQTLEKEKYDHHQNSPKNLGYVKFLDKLLIPLQTYLPTHAKGLDFGSGPGPTLSVLMKQRGYDMNIYDYFYAPDRSVFRNKYDFITATEVIEHLHNPLHELTKLWDCLEPDGILGLMTAFRIDDFANWYYKRDLTHISFYTQDTFTWIANYFNAQLIIPQSGVIILQKSKY